MQENQHCKLHLGASEGWDLPVKHLSSATPFRHYRHPFCTPSQHGDQTKIPDRPETVRGWSAVLRMLQRAPACCGCVASCRVASSYVIMCKWSVTERQILPRRWRSCKVRASPITIKAWRKHYRRQMPTVISKVMWQLRHDFDSTALTTYRVDDLDPMLDHMAL